MEYTLQERGQQMIEDCLKMNSSNPIEIFITLANKEYIRIHGPEHHILDGACILTAFCHAGGEIDLKEGLEKLMTEGLRMPGAACDTSAALGKLAKVGGPRCCKRDALLSFCKL